MMEFRLHDGFEKEIAALEKRRMRFIRESLKSFQNVCEKHFHPTSPEAKITPGKIHRVIQNDVWTLWKTELAVIKSDLRPNQYPRIWFAVSGATIVFLCIGTHVDNYNDNEMNRLALERATEMF